MSQYSHVVDRYEKGIEALQNAVRGVPEGMADRQPAPGKWTIREILAHLADAEIVGAARFRWIAAEPGSALKAFDQNAWATNLAYQKQEVQASLDAFRALRTSTAAMLRTLPDSAWSNTGVHEERGEVSLIDLVRLNAEHVEKHAQQISNIRAEVAASA
jgi:hypothetical protein